MKQEGMKVFGIAGYSGSGKTTLIEQVLPLLRSRGLVVSVIKHTHHDFELDRPGKDSWRQRQAGAHEVLLSGGRRWALLHEIRSDEALPGLEQLLKRLAPCDLVLVEGYKGEPIPKLEVHRADLDKGWLYPQDCHILAVVSDVTPPEIITIFDINKIEQITVYIIENSKEMPC